MKSSRKVVKSLEITTRNPCPDLFVEYHIESIRGNKKTAEQRQPMTNAYTIHVSVTPPRDKILHVQSLSSHIREKSC